MSDREYGPFETERDVLATRAAAALRAACDAHPGNWEAEHLKVIASACEEVGVTLAAFDFAPLRQLAIYEAFHAVVIAGMIHRAYQAGLAARAVGTVAEWGACRRGEAEPFVSGPDEAAVRRLAGDLPNAVTGLVRREVGPWKEVSGGTA